MTAKECGVSFWGNKNVQTLIVVMETQLCEYTKNYWIVRFKMVHRMLYELYLNEAVKEKGNPHMKQFILPLS